MEVADPCWRGIDPSDPLKWLVTRPKALSSGKYHESNEAEKKCFDCAFQIGKFGYSHVIGTNSCYGANGVMNRIVPIDKLDLRTTIAIGSHLPDEDFVRSKCTTYLALGVAEISTTSHSAWSRAVYQMTTACSKGVKESTFLVIIILLSIQ